MSLPRHRRRLERRLRDRLRPPGSPNYWLIVPLLIASVLLLGWIVGTLATTDLVDWARGLVRMRSLF
ncbi:MAG TPA: hypothetical protein VKG64_00865 [Methylomirabilota bacterium]|nr:hypothetical protein [Methylomirabilota bacterium]